MIDRRRLGLISLDYSSADKCLEAVVEHGFGFLELYIDELSTDEVRAFSSRCGSKGVTISAVSTLSKLGSVEGDQLPLATQDVRRSISLAADLGVSRAGFMFGGSGALNPSAARRRFADRVHPIIELGEQLGVLPVIENVFTRSDGVDLESVEAITELFQLLPDNSMGLTFDAANLAIGGEEAFPYGYDRLAEWISAVHLKDVTRYVPSIHGRDLECRPLRESRRGRFVTKPLGEGALNVRGLVHKLIRHEQRAPILLEPFRTGGSRELWLSRSLEELDSIAAGESSEHV